MCTSIQMSNTVVNCSEVSKDDRVALAVIGIIGGVASILCGVAIILVVVLKLYKQLVYRMSLYLVSSAFAFGIVNIIHLVQLPILVYSESHQFNHPLCIAAGFLAVYFLFVKLLFTLSVTIHLFCFAVCYKNRTKLEPIYVVVSLSVPGLVSVIPFTTNTYGPAGGWCWIENWRYDCATNIDQTGVIQQFALWFAPATLGLVVTSALVLTMMTILAYRAYGTSTVNSRSFRQALRQMLPLVIYPIIFCALLLPTLAHRIYDAVPTSQTYEYMLVIMDAVCSSGYSLVAGLSLLVHIAVVVLSRRRLLTRSSGQAGREAVINEGSHILCTIGSLPTKAVGSSTYASFATESEVSIN